MEDLDKEFTELVKAANKASGMDDLTSRLYSILYLEPDPISLEDLAQKTGYSLASISNKVNMLESAGLVSKGRKPKSKKIFVYMDKSILRFMKEMLVRKHQHCIEEASSHLPAIIERYSRKVKSEKDKKKLDILKSYQKQVNQGKSIIGHMVKKIEEAELKE